MSFDPIAFLERAVRTPSHEDVTEMRDLLVATLESSSVAGNVSVEVDDAGNTVAVRDADREGPHVVLNTHVDTVPPHVPFEREEGKEREAGVEDETDSDETDEGGTGETAETAAGGEAVVRGRGSCDAKGPLAAMLAAFLGTDPERGRLTLAVTPDEETGSTGAAALFDPDSGAGLGPSPDAVIVGEPTELDVCNAAKGRFQATVTVRGANAHAAEPESGVNAVRAVGSLLGALDTFDDREGRPDASDALGEPTLVPTTVEGGTATNQVPAESSFVVDRRSVPPETAEGFCDALEDHLQAHVPAETPVDVSVSLAERETPFLAPFETPADESVVRALRAASGGAVRPFGAATEASYFAERAPTVVFGPGALADDEGAVAHAPREYVRVAEVRRAGEAIAETLATLLA